ncbi:hypothetical protein BVTX09c5_022 [Bovine papular stomatitis virus]|uniref:Protein E6 homolog n=1 Tax=Bovine papular stomatitis virus TaxID=129727 RepID=A0A0E3T7G5_9POXV|nr:hypothetical protein BVTX09c15_022 [Bovine papular stomatitis virus]AKC03320.1 hypothetical protein BVTX09c5_022 [Bovine papular stomatitis virus]
MDFIRRKYMIHAIDRNLDFMRAEFQQKVSIFSLGHVLALHYLVTTFPHAVVTKDVLASTNFFVFVHMSQRCEVFDAVLRAAFDAPQLFVRALSRNFEAFSSAIQAYRTACAALLQDARFMEVAARSAELAEVIGVNYDLASNPLFADGEPIRDMELVFARLFRKTEFRAVKRLAVLRLLVWAFLVKRDVGGEYADNDRQDLFTLLQKAGPVRHSGLTESIREYMFPGDKPSYWVWLNARVTSDADVYRDRNARTLYERVLSYAYSEVKQGRVNANTLKLVYRLEDDPDIRGLLLQLIYDVPGDILGVVDSADEEWRQYFVRLYRENFVDGKTFTADARFRDDLFRVVAAVDPDFFEPARIREAFGADARLRERFADMDLNGAFMSHLVYGTADPDLHAAERGLGMRLYNEDSEFFIREYNTYLFLTEDDPLVLDRGALSKLSDVPRERHRELFSDSVLRYFLDAKLGTLGLVLEDYSDDVVASMLRHLRRVEDVSSFVTHAARRNAAAVPGIVRAVVSNFNPAVVAAMRPFLRENLTRVEALLDGLAHLTPADKQYIRRVILQGRS